MPDQVTLTVTRYRPERDAAPSEQSFEVPFRKDWVVLDALNHIKDRMDGSLSFRWSCRMGVCGSCSMMVNGVPRLTCAAFLKDFLPGPIRVEPLRYFPVLRDLVVEIGDFMHKLKRVKPWLVEAEAKPLETGEHRQTPEQLEHVHQLPALLLGLSDLRSGGELHRPGGHRARPALQSRLPRPRRPGAHGHSDGAGRHLGVHVRRRVHEGLSEKRGPGRGHSAIQTRESRSLGQELDDAEVAEMISRFVGGLTDSGGVPVR